MSFVGTRPEVTKYVERYKPEYNATLLMPAGITSEASIEYLEEEKLLKKPGDIDKIYLEEVQPEKMQINLNSIRNFSLPGDIITMLRTAVAVCRRV